jgi:dUTPase
MSPKSTILIRTGIIVSWDNPNFYLKFFTNEGIEIKDADMEHDYKKEINLKLTNNSTTECFIINRGDIIAKYSFFKKIRIQTTTILAFSNVENFNDNSRIFGFKSSIV